MNDENSSALVPLDETRKRAEMEAMRAHHMGTTVASLCGEIVFQSSILIKDKRYVPASSWCAIAAAHGYVVGTESVEFIAPGTESEQGGFRAIGVIRNAMTGAEIARGEGFVGTDEPVWFGGEVEVWNGKERRLVKKTYPKRSEFAIRAMSQTRAAGRVCKQAFAHVVVMMDKGLQTTPAEEMQAEPEELEASTHTNGRKTHEMPRQGADKSADEKEWAVDDWRYVRLHWPKAKAGMQLGECKTATLEWYYTNFHANVTPEDRQLRSALDQWAEQSNIHAAESVDESSKLPEGGIPA